MWWGHDCDRVYALVYLRRLIPFVRKLTQLRDFGGALHSKNPSTALVLSSKVSGVKSLFLMDGRCPSIKNNDPLQIRPTLRRFTEFRGL